MKKETKETVKKINRVYLDFASQTIISKKVLSEMKRVSEKNFNPANIYFEGVNAEKVLNDAREKVARVLGVQEKEIYFTHNATSSCAAAIWGTFLFYKNNFNYKNKKYLKPHIITSSIEHNAVLENIKCLEMSDEIEATYVSCDENGIIKVNDVIKEIKENTILVSIMSANNEVGTIQEIKNISKGIKEWKKENKKEIFSYPYFHTDACQAGNYLSLYTQSLGVDMLSLNGSKIYGPKSSAILFKKEYCNILPIYLGGGQERNLFSGTVDIEKCLGLSVALEEAQKKIKKENNGENFLESVAIKRNNLLKNILKNIPEAKMIGAWNENEWKENKIGIVKEFREAKRLPNNISLWLPDFNSDEMVIRLDQKGFAVSAGSACSAKSDEYSHVIYNIVKVSTSLSPSKGGKEMQTQIAKKIARETIRITIDANTKEEDLKRFVLELKKIYYKFKNNY